MVRDRLNDVSWEPGSISLREFDTQPNTTGEESIIAETQVGRPLRLRDDDDSEIRLVLPCYEHFTTDATADNQETFELSHDLIESPTTIDLLVWEDGQVVNADAIDYGADSFDYTSGGTETDLDVFYVAREPAEIEIRKAAPGAGGTVNQSLKQAQTAVLHTRDQSKQEVQFGFSRTELQPLVPRKFKLQVLVTAPYQVQFEAPSRSNGTPRATNALLSLPRRQTEARINGLGDAVKQDMIGVRG